MKPEFGKLNPSDTGMCPHGNFNDGCTACKEGLETTRDKGATLERAIKPESVRDYSDLSQKAQSKARELYENELEYRKKRNNPNEYSVVASLYDKLGNQDEARSYWGKHAKEREESVELSKKNKNYAPTFYLAEAYAKSSNGDKAREFYQEYITMASDKPHVLLAEAYEQIGDSSKALEVWKIIAEEESKDPNKPFQSRYYDVAARAYEKLGNRDEVNHMWIKALHYAEDIGHEMSIIEALEKLGDSERAIGILEKILNQDLKNSENTNNFGIAGVYERLARLYGGEAKKEKGQAVEK